MKFVLSYALVITFVSLINFFLSKTGNQNNINIYKDKNFKRKINGNLIMQNDKLKIEDIFINHEKDTDFNLNRYSLGPDFRHLINNHFYKDFLNKSRPMSTKLKYSKPFTKILHKAIGHFPADKTVETAELEIESLRKLSTDKTADYFANLKVNNTQEYWYYYYVLSKVALKGRINQTNELAEEWDLPNINEPDMDFISDVFYQKLNAKDHYYSNKLEICKIKTLAEIKAYIDKDSTQKIEKYPHHLFEAKKFSNLDNWYFHIKNISNYQLSDIRFRDRLVNYIKNKSTFYNQIKSDLPKGIIHHIHLSACFDNFYNALMNTFINSTDKNSTFKGEFVRVALLEEDKIKKGNFTNTFYIKVFFIEELKRLIFSSMPEKEKLFKENFILPNGRCTVFTSKTKKLPIEANEIIFFYWRFCRGFLYTNNEKEIKKIAKNKKIFSSTIDIRIRIKSLKSLGMIMKREGNIFEVPQIRNLPISKMRFSFSFEDYLSNAIWDKFEEIFGMYENLFDHPVLMKELLKILAKTFADQQIYGVEFRQKYDKSKTNSKYLAIKEAFAKENIMTAFILPGRKVVNGNKLRANTNAISKIAEEDVSGLDFVGYEDDPFSGARNFFSDTILSSKSNYNLTTDEFEMLYNTLKNGTGFYPHAGETIYIPDYPIDEKFMDKFYINDNLIHSALLPSVERLGHGFAVANNGLLATIIKKKKISLEICPVSNQLLYYHKIYENPGLKLLRHGLKVAISPDDPGFFGYMGVAMDWYHLIMQTDIKASEIYMLLKNSILKASPNIQKQKYIFILRLQKDLEKFFDNLNCELSKNIADSIKVSEDEISHRSSLQISYRDRIEFHFKTNYVLFTIQKRNILLNMYNKNHIINKANENFTTIS